MREFQKIFYFITIFIKICKFWLEITFSLTHDPPPPIFWELTTKLNPFWANTEWPPSFNEVLHRMPLLSFSGRQMYVTFIFECPPPAQTLEVKCHPPIAILLEDKLTIGHVHCIRFIMKIIKIVPYFYRPICYVFRGTDSGISLIFMVKYQLCMSFHWNYIQNSVVEDLFALQHAWLTLNKLCHLVWAIDLTGNHFYTHVAV